MSDELPRDGHLTPTDLAGLQNGTMEEAQRLSAAAHIGECPVCAQRFAQLLETGALAPSPSGFAQAVQHRQRKQKAQRDTSFLFYSLRVCAAVCASLIIVFSGVLNTAASAKFFSGHLPAPNCGFINNIDSGIRHFSNCLTEAVNRAGNNLSFSKK